MMWIKCRWRLRSRNADRPTPRSPSRCETAEESSRHRNTARIEIARDSPRDSRRAHRVALESLARLARIVIIVASRHDGADACSATRIGDRRLGRRPVRRPSAARSRLGRRGVRARRGRPRRPRHRHRHARGTVRRDAPDRACRRRVARDRRRGPHRPRPRRRRHSRTAGARRHQRLVAHLAAAAAGVAGRAATPAARRCAGSSTQAERRHARFSTTARAPRAISWSQPTACIRRFARNSFPASRRAMPAMWLGAAWSRRRAFARACTT